MRILYYEMRRIWKLKTIAALLLLGVLFYHLFLYYPIESFPNGQEEFDLVREWTEKYGYYMNENERIDAQKQYDALIDEVNAILSGDERFTAHGLDSWERVQEAVSPRSPGYSDEKHAIRELLFQSEYDYIGYRVEALYNALICYDTRGTHQPDVHTPAEAARLAELCEEPRVSGIFAANCCDNLSEYMCWVAIFSLLSVIILLTPAGARDNLSRVTAMQWTSRTGRRILRTQLAANLLSALLLFVLECLIFGGIYSTLETQYFWNNPTTTFIYGYTFWFDLTYGQYVLVFAAMLLALMLGAAGLCFLLSRTSAHYIAALLKALPLFVLLMFTAAAVMGCPLTNGNALYQHVRVFGVEGILCAIVLLVGLAAAALLLAKSRQKELF